jgi:hypothetical protein
MIAALYVETGGVYYGLPDVDPWDEERDARLYVEQERLVRERDRAVAALERIEDVTHKARYPDA